MDFIENIISAVYGGILLPPTCKINYVNMHHKLCSLVI